MVLLNKSAFDTATGLPKQTGTAADLRVVVLYTTPELTKEALRYAAALGNGLNVNLTLLDIQVVPYACPMDRPPIDREFSRLRLEKLAQESGASVQVEVVYARDREKALVRRLSAGSLVLIPVKGFLGRLFQKPLMRKLSKHGHDVVLVPCK
jgi:hypothetical protein